ncbi:acylneuraminate cytidylyltransferase family protein [Candidatus Synechococcus calcipolaris G9]|uniref:Acylneuraminate cytidylyltransferase family protein n=1 Tax=Candidatus Synechococcus calcipolaris G9 TaxID=1497997 RepID=A0ABT6F3E1_9SYNE|nr:acylneuraminate cytidylyltransferase family protein [Candidatus Synechococcus calcipolaris]MDG2992380.1 acylneuraminate cytidylyltransferase family protein [Candidatus Synechococcus calcipolaris G9]
MSTDDPEIAAIARSAEAMVPWLRPHELASDTASIVDVCLHTLSWYVLAKGSVDGLLLLQPTSPFRSKETIKKGIHLFEKYKYRTILGVSPAKSHPMWCFQIKDDKMEPFITGGLKLRSQDLPKAYTINGSFYLITPHNLQKYKSFFNNDPVPLEINSFDESIDIDNSWDWKIAEYILSCKHLASPEG